VIVHRTALEQRALQALDAGRIPVLLGGCGTGRTSALLRLASLLGGGRSQYIDIAAAATTPERCLQAIVSAMSPGADSGPATTHTPPASARAAFESLLAFLDAAVAPGNGPVTFLCDEILDIRTFESFPGLRHVQRELIERLAASPNGFVLASRFTSRAHRLLRDATARFEVIHIPPFGADDVRGLLAQRNAVDTLTPAQTAGVAALCGHRAAYAAILLDVLLAQPASRRHPVTALTSALGPDGPLAARCRESYEFRLHRARGYGALKAILGILAEQESLTLTEISQRLQRTPGSTKDYLSWLEDVDLLTMQRKRYVFDDAVLRLHIRLYGGPMPPSAQQIAAEVSAWADRYMPEAAPEPEPVLATAGADRSGIIEID
jgi:hypothetical protein